MGEASWQRLLENALDSLQSDPQFLDALEQFREHLGLCANIAGGQRDRHNMVSRPHLLDERGAIMLVKHEFLPEETAGGTLRSHFYVTPSMVAG